MLRLDDEPRLVVAGRTDAGVHARGQVCHADLPARAWAGTAGRSGREPGVALERRLRGVLPPDVRVHRVRAAPQGFDARFSAVRRRYAYRVSEAPSGPDPLRRFDVLDHRRPLDVEAMSEAAQQLVGLHDFAAFCRRRAGATTIRTLLGYRWHRPAAHEPDSGLAMATVEADAFCHSMVRALVGAVLPVGAGRRPVDWPAQVLAAGVRDAGVTVVSPAGLTLEEVTYPPDDQLAVRAEQARTTRQLP